MEKRDEINKEKPETTWKNCAFTRNGITVTNGTA
jgi:hypothetical protein